MKKILEPVYSNTNLYAYTTRLSSDIQALRLTETCEESYFRRKQL